MKHRLVCSTRYRKHGSHDHGQHDPGQPNVEHYRTMTFTQHVSAKKLTENVVRPDADRAHKSRGDNHASQHDHAQHYDRWK